MFVMYKQNDASFIVYCSGTFYDKSNAAFKIALIKSAFAINITQMLYEAGSVFIISGKYLQ